MRIIFSFISICLVASLFCSCSREDLAAPAYNQLAEQSLDSNYDSAIYYARQSLKQGLGDEKDFYSYFLIGYSYDRKGLFINAYNSYERAILIVPDDSKFDFDRYGIHNNIGKISESYNNYEIAITSYEKALEYVTDKGKVNVLYNLSNVYRKMRDHGTAQSTIDEALQLASAFNDEARLVKIHYRIGQIQSDQKQFDLARSTYEKVLTLAGKDTEKHARYIGKAYHNMGNTYLLEGKYDMALNWFQKALSAKRSEKDKFITYMDMGTSLQNMKQHQQAVSYYRKAEVVFDQTEPSKDFIKLFNLMSEVHHKLGMYEDSHAYSQLYFEKINGFVADKEQIMKQLKAARFRENHDSLQAKLDLISSLIWKNNLLTAAVAFLLLALSFVWWQKRKMKRLRKGVAESLSGITSLNAPIIVSTDEDQKV
ncbi:MAG: tetratricopeptide repeat protein [Bacteroidota bacterium]